MVEEAYTKGEKHFVDGGAPTVVTLKLKLIDLIGGDWRKIEKGQDWDGV